MADIIFPGAVPDGEIGDDQLPGNLDLALWQGDYLTYIVNLTAEDGTPINLNGYTGRATIRASFTDPKKYSFTVTQTDLNQFTLYLPSSVSKDISPGSYVWEFQVIAPNSDVRTYLAGDVTVYAEVDA